MWTENDGKEWRRILLPSNPVAGTGASGIFFLDTHKGWALFIDHDKNRPQLYLSSTTDAGLTWSPYSRLNLPEDLPNPYGLPISGCGADLTFFDTLHGWMDVTLSGETMNSWWSYLLVTSDGGRSWKLASGAPELEAPSMLLMSPREGWMLGSSRDNPYHELHVTRDGGKSWQDVSLGPPKAVLPATEPDYRLPTFVDPEHGYLQVNYESADDLFSAALFATNDAGRTWKVDRSIKNVRDQGLLEPSSAGVTDSAWLFVAVSEHLPRLTKVDHGEAIDASAQATRSASYHRASALSFASPSQGWVIVGDGQLLSTKDGGASWIDITPGPKQKPSNEHANGSVPSTAFITSRLRKNEKFSA